MRARTRALSAAILVEAADWSAGGDSLAAAEATASSRLRATAALCIRVRRLLAAALASAVVQSAVIGWACARIQRALHVGGGSSLLRQRVRLLPNEAACVGNDVESLRMVVLVVPPEHWITYGELLAA